MATFQEKSDQLAQFIGKYMSASTILNNTHALYERHKTNETLVSYLAPVEFINLVTTSEYAQDCYEYYIQIKNDGTLPKEEKQKLIEQFKPFKARCKLDQIDYKQPRNRAVLYPNQTDLPFNADRTVNQLDLMGHYLNGVAKICAALNGQRYSTKTIIDYSNSGGTMNPQGELRLDATMLNQSPVLNIHIKTHEYGHLWSNFFSGKTVGNDGISIPNVQLLLPSYVRSATSPAQKEEALADYFAAVISGIFKIPPSVIYTRFYSFLALPSSSQHPTGSIRSELIQSAASIIGHHIDDDQFKNNRWAELASRIQAMPNITFKQLPNSADFDLILKEFPQNRTRQLEELEAEFPTLFSPPTWGVLPPSIVVASDLRTQLASINNPALFNPNRALVPLVTVPEFQRSWTSLTPVIPPTPMTWPQPVVPPTTRGRPPVFPTPGVIWPPRPALTPTQAGRLPPTPFAFPVQPTPRLGPRVPAPTVRTQPIPPQPITFRPRGRGLIDTERNEPMTYAERNEPTATLVKDAPVARLRTDARSTDIPFLMSAPLATEMAHTTNAPLTTDMVAQNLMLGKVLIKMAKNGVQWLAPSWSQTVKEAPKNETANAPMSVKAGKKTQRLGV